MSSFNQSDESCTVVDILDYASRENNTSIVEGNMVNAKGILIPANQKVHMTIEFDCKQQPMKISITSYIRILD